MMREPRDTVRTAEKVAGVVAVIAALVVLNGAWVNQHSWQNVSWRVAVAALLIVLAIAVETNLLALLQRREIEEQSSVPEFLRLGSDEPGSAVEPQAARSDAVSAGERT
jgi:hypothetical protein